MVVTTSTTYHRSSAAGAVPDSRPRRATQLGRCQRIAGVPLSSVYSNGSVGSYPGTSASTPTVSRASTRHYRSSYAATPTSRGSSIDRDLGLGSDSLWKSEQYFSKLYPSYFTGVDHVVSPRSRAVSVDREAYAASPLHGSVINYDMSSGGDNYDDLLYRSALSRLDRSPSVPLDVGSAYDVGRVPYDVGRVTASRPVSRPVGSAGSTRVTRAASVSRVPYSDDDDEDDEEFYRRRRQRRMRASSIARYRFAARFPDIRNVGGSLVTYLYSFTYVNVGTDARY